MMSGRFLSRIRNLEDQQPAPEAGAAFRERIERAKARIEANMTEEERTEWHARLEAKALDRRGRKPLLADRLRAAQNR